MAEDTAHAQAAGAFEPGGEREHLAPVRLGHAVSAEAGLEFDLDGCGAWPPRIRPDQTRDRPQPKRRARGGLGRGARARRRVRTLRPPARARYLQPSLEPV